MTKKKLPQPLREGKPTVCISCGGPLHPKSEHYCGMACEQVYTSSGKENAPPFLSKWKIRKRKAQKDPLVNLRAKIRDKSKKLLKEGKIQKKPCLVCGSRDVVMHHEDYDNPYHVLWLCDAHHREYHDGKIGLFGNTLWWDSSRLIPKRYQGTEKRQKYAALDKNLERKKTAYRQADEANESADSTVS